MALGQEIARPARDIVSAAAGIGRATLPRGEGGADMGKADKAKNKAEEMVGEARANKPQREAGQRKKTKANLKQAGEKVKDAVKK